VTLLALSNVAFVLLLGVVMPMSMLLVVREWRAYNEGRQDR